MNNGFRNAKLFFIGIRAHQNQYFTHLGVENTAPLEIIPDSVKYFSILEE
jgi:hypothetical protein